MKLGLHMNQLKVWYHTITTQKRIFVLGREGKQLTCSTSIVLGTTYLWHFLLALVMRRKFFKLKTTTFLRWEPSIFFNNNGRMLLVS
jgi:hypothetical protein